MQPNDLSLSVHNPILIYSFLALYGILTVAVLIYVQTKFRYATKALAVLKTEWDSADSRHAGFVGKAQEQMAKLSVPAPPRTPSKATTPVNFDVRNQVAAMGKKGFSSIEIAKACGLQEGEVEVLLGITRLQR